MSTKRLIIGMYLQFELKCRKHVLTRTYYVHTYIYTCVCIPRIPQLHANNTHMYTTPTCWPHLPVEYTYICTYMYVDKIYMQATPTHMETHLRTCKRHIHPDHTEYTEHLRSNILSVCTIFFLWNTRVNTAITGRANSCRAISLVYPVDSPRRSSSLIIFPMTAACTAACR